MIDMRRQLWAISTTVRRGDDCGAQATLRRTQVLEERFMAEPMQSRLRYFAEPGPQMRQRGYSFRFEGVGAEPTFRRAGIFIPSGGQAENRLCRCPPSEPRSRPCLRPSTGSSISPGPSPFVISFRQWAPTLGAPDPSGEEDDDLDDEAEVWDDDA
jgi:hypothetical protein